ncbi:hypothetical protein KGY77_06940 [Candidatus Bipolaricaulota bacterium]|nr:hypothetical protein [Candidatus Bipolaricaulota bacterium]
MLETILIVAFSGAIVSYILGKVSSRMRNYLSVLVWLSLVGLTSYIYFSTPARKVFYPDFLGFDLALRINYFSWLFAITITVIATLCVVFSFNYIKSRERTDFYYLTILLVNASMLGIVVSGDLLTFYVFWEIMSWSAFLLISYNRGAALAAGLRYIVMSIIGSGAMLIGVTSLYSNFGTLALEELPDQLATSSSLYLLFIFLLFFLAFGIKNAILPFHTWLPPAHSEAPAPFSAILSGMLIKMGTYGIILLFYVISGIKLFLGLSQGIWSFHYILCGLAAVTIVVPTFIAVLQDDAKKLLAWSTIGQAGYIIIGISFGTSLSMAGGIFHFFNHAIFKSLLFLAIGAVEYRTSTRDLNSLGGLIKKMPVAFLATLVGIGGLIGIPLTNGFFSKWLIYKSLILDGQPFLAFAALIGTWGAILYSYKLLHNVFLGQLPEKYDGIKKAPLTMQLPLGILSLGVLIFGILPGLPLNPINKITTSLGFDPLNLSIWGTVSDTGTVNTLNIFLAFVVVAGILWYVFRSGAKSPEIAQEDSYAAGAPIPEGKYNYTIDFYNPLERMMKPFLRDLIDDFYSWIVEATNQLSNMIRKTYSGYVGTYVMYIVALLAALILVQLGWKIW